MDSQSFDLSKVVEFDENFVKLLEVGGSFFKRFKYRKCVREAKSFYAAYIKKCNEYNTYLDFFTPLYWYLISCGFGLEKSAKYLDEIRGGLLAYLKDSIGSGTFTRLQGEVESFGQDN